MSIFLGLWNEIFNSSMVDPDASTVVYNDNIANLHDFIDEFPAIADNNFGLLEISKDSGFSSIASQELKCPCCLQEPDDIESNWIILLHFLTNFTFWDVFLFLQVVILKSKNVTNLYTMTVFQ